MGTSNEMLRSMVEYRAQNVDERRRHIYDDVQRKVWDEARGVDGAFQHTIFKRLVAKEAREFYACVANEVERWHRDRERIFQMKYEKISVNRPITASSSGSGHHSPARLMRDISRSIGTVLEAELKAQRSKVMQSFWEKFSIVTLENFPGGITAIAQCLMEQLRRAFYNSLPFVSNNLCCIISDVPLDGLFLSDVVSICFSLGSGLSFPPESWLGVLRDRMEFAARSRKMVELPDDGYDFTWILAMHPSEVGPHVIRWLCSSKFADDIRCSEVEESLVRFLRSIPTPHVLEALMDGGRPTSAALEDLRNSGKCSKVVEPLLQTLGSLFVGT
jgi:hypothetical protein